MLCSGNGDYEKGVCVCHTGWKGAECEVEEGLCIDPTCSNNGECVNGICVCAPAFKGDNCEQGTAHIHTHIHTLKSFIKTFSAFDGLDSFLDRKIEFEAQITLICFMTIMLSASACVRIELQVYLRGLFMMNVL